MIFLVTQMRPNKLLFVPCKPFQPCLISACKHQDGPHWYSVTGTNAQAYLAPSLLTKRPEKPICLLLADISALSDIC
jgi:hypothetical protein